MTKGQIGIETLVLKSEQYRVRMDQNINEYST